MRRAKIVATLGPATSSYEQIRAIIEAGVNITRMNLSHGSYDVHEGVYNNVRKAAADTGKAVGDLETAADSGKCVALTGVTWAVDGKDSSNVTEIRIA